MNIYPALKGHMGSWQYFTVKMSMRELADNVKFAEDVYQDRTLDEAIQRELAYGRVKTDLVKYLIRQKDRFFSSVVVAALEGNPKWFPVTMEDDERFMLFRDDARFNDTFGVLSFDGTQNYYALDGQHRLAAIKALVDPSSDVQPNAPDGFRDEEISVIVVVPTENESQGSFLRRYRRLFGNLNRYAKPTDTVTNIIMDEDDAFAIITRRLISEHSFFRYSGRDKESIKIKTSKGKNLKTADSYFTSLESLYSINIALLNSHYRSNHGWNGEGETKFKEFSKFRPDEELIDELFDELVLYWDALLEELPILREEPSKMRNHSVNQRQDSVDERDVVLFWPIGQELLAAIARQLMDDRQSDPSDPTEESVKNSLRGLGGLNWNAHEVPWRHLLLIPASEDNMNWRIRSEERKEALIVARQIVQWQIGLDELSEDDVEQLRNEWKNMLLPALNESEVQNFWKEIESAVQRSEY